MHILSRDVLHRIREGDMLWEGMVPAEIAEVIKTRRFFGYRGTEVGRRSEPKVMRSGIGS